MVGDKATLQTNTVRAQAGRVKGGAYLETRVLPHFQVRVLSTGPGSLVATQSQHLAKALCMALCMAKHSCPSAHPLLPVSRSLPNIPFYIHVIAFSEHKLAWTS